MQTIKIINFSYAGSHQPHVMYIPSNNELAVIYGQALVDHNYGEEYCLQIGGDLPRDLDVIYLGIL